MVVERYDPANLSELVPKLGLKMEPELCQLDRLLSDDVFFNRAKRDMGKRHRNSARLGRHSTPVEVMLWILETIS